MKGEVAAAGLVSVLGEAAVAWSEARLSVTASNPFTVPPSPWKAAAGTISQKMYNGHKQTLVGIDNRQLPQSATEQCPIVV